MLRKFQVSAVAALCVTMAAPAFAQDTRAEASAFATRVALADSDAQYARWNTGLCPSVAGLPAAEAQVIIDHIARRAHRANVSVGGADCARNLVIIFAPDGAAVARELVSTRPDLLGFASALEIAPSLRPRLDAFVAADRPVRFWHLTNTMAADGSAMRDGEARTGRSTRDALAASRGGGTDAVMQGSGLSNVESVRADGTRFRSTTREDLNFALIVVDTTRIAGMPPAAVADYLAMASLVQLDPNADVAAYPTILNLFSGTASAPAAMTAWDEGFLEGLYRGTNRNTASLRQQRAEIARRIERASARD